MTSALYLGSSLSKATSSASSVFMSGCVSTKWCTHSLKVSCKHLWAPAAKTCQESNLLFFTRIMLVFISFINIICINIMTIIFIFIFPITPRVYTGVWHENSWSKISRSIFWSSIRLLHCPTYKIVYLRGQCSSLVEYIHWKFTGSFQKLPTTNITFNLVFMEKLDKDI